MFVTRLARSADVAVHHFGDQDPGAFLSVSGAEAGQLTVDPTPDAAPGAPARPDLRSSRPGRLGRSPVLLVLAVLVAALALLPLGYIVGSTVDVGWSGVR